MQTNQAVKESLTTQLDAKTLAYLDGLAADIAAHGGATVETIEKAFSDAHARRHLGARY